MRGAASEAHFAFRQLVERCSAGMGPLCAVCRALSPSQQLPLDCRGEVEGSANAGRLQLKHLTDTLFADATSPATAPLISLLMQGACSRSLWQHERAGEKRVSLIRHSYTEDLLFTFTFPLVTNIRKRSIRDYAGGILEMVLGRNFNIYGHEN